MSVKFKETIQQTTGDAANGAAAGLGRFAQGVQNGDGKRRGPVKELAHEAGEYLTKGGGARGYLQVGLLPQPRTMFEAYTGGHQKRHAACDESQH